MEKKEIRKLIFARRRQLDAGELERRSQMICKRIMELEQWKTAGCVYAYMDCKGEVCMRPILETAWAEGKRIAVPKVFGEEMRFFYIQAYEETAPGYYGIPEPTGGEEAVCEDALMIMPGVAFDKEGRRCGYGGGFYDRFLSVHTGLTTIAPAFEFQIVEEVPKDVFDIAPHTVVTESRIFHMIK